MLALQVLTFLVLLMIFIQDLKSRSVYWFLFPLLAMLLTVIHFLQVKGWAEVAQTTLINLGFLIAQLLIMSAYFSLKNRQWVNITQQLLGWGDILFLLSISFYLSVLNFLFFYIISLVAVLLFWLLWNTASSKKNAQIPLAGFQALILILFLASDWYFLHLNIMDDTWLLNLINK